MDPFAKVNPVKPPKVNKNKNPIAKRLGVITISEPLHKLAPQLNILIPVGRAMTEVAAVN
jgi:hypothetical protein